MKLAFIQAEGFDDWYTIERAEHNHTSWIEPMPGVPYARSYQHSGRISDACVEGPLSEMVSLAQAIEDKTKEDFKRCAVDARSEPVRFWSPRNSERQGEVSYEDALDLAQQIRRAALDRAMQGEGKP